MTFLEKLKEDNPNMHIDEYCRGIGCPSDRKYEENRPDNCGGIYCKECWNREMPSTEFKQKVVNPPTQETLDFIHANIEKIQPHFENPVIEKAYSKGYADGMSEGLTQGQNDVWDALNKIHCEILCGELDKIFGYSDTACILEAFTPQEALAKLKAYEDSKIEVGDVVFCKALTEFDDRANKENYGVVTGIYSDHYEILMKNGDTTGFELKECEKTGKHIDISSILEQIGE